MKLNSRPEFEKAYQEHSPAIYRFIYWQTKNPELAQDLTSSVFEKAWRSRASFKGGSVKAWLYRIARNSVIDHWRKKRELLMEDFAGLSDQLESSAAQYDYDREQLAWQLARALDQLPENLRSVVVLRFIEGLSARQVGETLGLTEVNVRVMQYRALRKLKGWIDHEA